MDRDKRWDRIRLAYDGLVGGKGQEASPDQVIQVPSSPPPCSHPSVERLDQVVKERYAKDETDEFLKPIIVNKQGCIKGRPFPGLFWDQSR